LGKLEKAEELYVRVIAIDESHYSKNHFLTANSLNNLGEVFRM
jgi:hypothetical protein